MLRELTADSTWLLYVESDLCQVKLIAVRYLHTIGVGGARGRPEGGFGEGHRMVMGNLAAVTDAGFRGLFGLLFFSLVDLSCLLVNFLSW